MTIAPERFRPSAEALRRFEVEASPGGYVALISGLLTRGFRVVWPEGFRPGSPHLMLRHDVDLDLVRAAELARIERTLGVRSLYFVLIGSQFYNPLSRAGRSLVREIVSCGHRVELHFDPGPDARPEDDDLHARARAEASMLARTSGRRVRMIAFHRPTAQAPWILGYPGTIGGRPHTYAPPWFGPVDYRSDGAAHWHHGHPHKAESVARGTAMQLVTHPYLWTAPSGTPTAARIDQTLEEHGARLRAGALGEFQTYAYVKHGLDGSASGTA